MSHYRLAGHLLLALSLFALLFWNALGELRTRPAVRAPLAAHRLALALAVVIILTATWGAFMAGLHAGHVAPSFPTMNGRLIPDGLWSGSSVLASFLEDAMTVHFVHRTLAYSVAVLTLSLAWYVHRAKLALETRRAALLLVGMVAIQITLGALTVLFYVPIALAAIHQTVAVVLLGIVLFLLSRTTQPRRSASVSASDAQPSALRA